MPTTGDKLKQQTQRKETSQQTSTNTKRKTTTRTEATQGREGKTNISNMAPHIGIEQGQSGRKQTTRHGYRSR